MIYPIQSVAIPQEQRKEINEKILYLIDAGLESNISRSDVFNAYTGDGGLHGLSMKDYNNFHEYSEAKKEIEVGQFFTPHQLCKFVIDCIRPNSQELVADLTCGMGNFFNYLPTQELVYGNEIDIKAYKVAKYLYPNANLQSEDIRLYDPKITFDLILGNPPFNLKWKVGKEEYLSQMYYCVKAHSLLKPGGLLALIVPSSFLADEFMHAGYIIEVNERFDFITQCHLPEKAFRDIGVESFPTKLMFFRKKSEHLTPRDYKVDHYTVISITEEYSHMLYTEYIQPAKNEKYDLKAKLFLDGLHQKDTDNFAYDVKKLLFDIQRHPKLRQHYAKCSQLVEQYLTQTKPPEMKLEEWEKKRLTKNKVLFTLRRTLRKQQEQQEHAIRLVKTNYGLRLKVYSQKMKLQLSKYKGTKEITFTDMIVNDQYPFEDTRYLGLFNRKKKDYLLQSQQLELMSADQKVDRYCDAHTLTNYNSANGLLFEVVSLNKMQKEDLRRLFRKRYGILNWQQGSGKTIAGMFWYNMLLKEKKVRNVFVVSAALAINLTWEPVLRDFNEDFIRITSIKDIESIRDGQIVIITSDFLIKLQRHIKKHVRKQGQKIALLYDESDEMTNYSKRTRAALNCFRKAKYKLLTTGTTTRNNISELYPQLELLYNNSVNMLCECSFIHKRNKDGELQKVENPFYFKPFPAFRGLTLFKECFSPHKATVFGIAKHNQDIYNIEALRSLIDKTIITRKFAEIVGEDKYKVSTHRILQNAEEVRVYNTIIKDFYQIVRGYYQHTGNERKESMLRIIRQIQLLIKATSVPQLLNEYTEDVLPAKFYKIAEMVHTFSSEKVAIGTVFRPAAFAYQQFLKKEFPDRPVFLIHGQIPFEERKGIIREFEETRNGVLVSTQQSLKSSVNIPSCNKVIIESMQWNIPKIEQYYFRFIRYNSKDFKEVHFVTYDYTIEQNLLALLMVKERVNEFIKTREFKEEAEIFEDYGIDLDIFENIMEKEIDSEGNVKITWGQQHVS
ncbi:N-6 DNA methylase [Brevibacillus sp. AG]|uniref:helicase-related protein n=1 Tax=Brevibacillus sp. AG TaxID=3020891 RepID=UPI002330721D|nr:helicase-related protein [Brevibacillus sp. AG]MDC0764140.1 N-6 DNA methylase [Brevibacillus sp. AG]